MRPIVPDTERAPHAGPGRRFVRLLNGLSVFLGGSTRRQMGNAPKERVLKQWQLEVHRLVPRQPEDHALGDDADVDPAARFPTPVLLLAFAGRSDNIATLGSTRDVLASVSSTDKTFVEVHGGHVGVIAGSTARADVWEPMADWLAPRSVNPSRG